MVVMASWWFPALGLGFGSLAKLSLFSLALLVIDAVIVMLLAIWAYRRATTPSRRTDVTANTPAPEWDADSPRNLGAADNRYAGHGDTGFQPRRRAAPAASSPAMSSSTANTTTTTATATKPARITTPKPTRRKLIIPSPLAKSPARASNVAKAAHAALVRTWPAPARSVPVNPACHSLSWGASSQHLVAVRGGSAHVWDLRPGAALDAPRRVVLAGAVTKATAADGVVWLVAAVHSAASEGESAAAALVAFGAPAGWHARNTTSSPIKSPLARERRGGGGTSAGEEMSYAPPRLWDRKRCHGIASGVSWIAASGATLATLGDKEGDLRIWSVVTGALRGTITSSSGAFAAAELVMNGTALCALSTRSGTNEHVIDYFRITTSGGSHALTARFLVSYTGKSSGIPPTLSASSDASSVAFADSDGGVRVWRLPPQLAEAITNPRDGSPRAARVRAKALGVSSASDDGVLIGDPIFSRVGSVIGGSRPVVALATDSRTVAFVPGDGNLHCHPTSAALPTSSTSSSSSAVYWSDALGGSSVVTSLCWGAPTSRVRLGGLLAVSLSDGSLHIYRR